MPDEVWRPLEAALDRAAQRGRIVEVWLRDDDAVSPSLALDRLIALSESCGLGVLLAVIPAAATAALADELARHPLIVPTQHGFRHANHAAAGERARELGGARPLTDILDELARGRDRLLALFGPGGARILVPPWNRIDEAVAAALPALGFEALSTFGPARLAVPGIVLLNTDLDIIDWRNGRVGRPHDQLAMKFAALVDETTAHPRPIGLLTHHLAHDETAWSFLDACLPRLARHPAVRFAAAPDLVRSARSPALTLDPATAAPDSPGTVPPGRSAFGP